MQRIEDLYPLSPMQEGLLFQTLLNAGSQAYVTQHSSVVQHLDIPCFQMAWQHLINRHPVLRTAFVWKTAARPLQAVIAPVEVPFDERDWRSLSPELQARSTAAYLAEDQAKSFDLCRAPLIRIAAARLSDRAHRVFVTHHHALLDGWSLPLLFGEVAVLYRLFCRGARPELPPVRPFRDYIAWLQQTDRSNGERYWRARFAGFRGPTAIGAPVSRPPGQLLTMSEEHSRLSSGCSHRFRTFVQSRGLTLHTLFAAAWALAVGSIAKTDDVVYGAVVSGRPPELSGVESMLGTFINTLPCRVQLRPLEPVESWLTALQAELVEMRQFQHNSLADVQKWVGVASGQDLFTTLLDSLNYPSQPADSCNETFHPTEGFYSNPNPYPLQLVTQELGSITLRVVYDATRLDSRVAGRMLRLTRWGIMAMMRHAKAPLGRVMRIIDEASRAYGRSLRRSGPPVVRASLHQSFASHAGRLTTHQESSL